MSEQCGLQQEACTGSGMLVQKPGGERRRCAHLRAASIAESCSSSAVAADAGCLAAGSRCLGADCSWPPRSMPISSSTCRGEARGGAGRQGLSCWRLERATARPSACSSGSSCLLRKQKQPASCPARLRHDALRLLLQPLGVQHVVQRCRRAGAGGGGMRRRLDSRAQPAANGRGGQSPSRGKRGVAHRRPSSRPPCSASRSAWQTAGAAEGATHGRGQQLVSRFVSWMATDT